LKYRKNHRKTQKQSEIGRGIEIALVMIWSPIDRILWGIALILSFICALKYLNLARIKENQYEKLISFGYSGIFFGLTLCIVFGVVSESLIPGKFINGTFYGNYDAAFKNLYYIIIWKSTVVVFFAGFTFFFYAFEIIIKRTKFLITIFHCLFLTLILLLPLEFAYYIVFSIYIIFLSISFFGIMLYYTRSSRSEIKAISSFILLGEMLIMVGSFLISDYIKRLNFIPLVIGPLLWSIGTLFCIAPTMIKSESIVKYLKITGTSTIGVNGVFTSFLLFYNYSLESVIGLIIANVLTLLILISIIKSHEVKGENGELKDFIEAWTKPKKVTEEEVSISKERKICLVCKNELSRENYICPDCKTFYCAKCSKTLSDLENACWVCNTPFDVSKTSKPFKKEGQAIDLEISEKPQKKPQTPKN